MASRKQFDNLTYRLQVAHRERDELEKKIGERWCDQDYEAFCRCVERIGFLEAQLNKKDDNDEANIYS